jgi:hypothetical protein
MTLHLSQIGLTLGLTFTVVPSFWVGLWQWRVDRSERGYL